MAANNAPSLEFLTPVGRLVGGDPYKPFTLDMQGQQMTIKSGPKAGQATQRFIAVVAFSKTDPAFAPFYQRWVQFAAQCWPQYYNPQTGTFTHRDFSLKFIDGDGVDNTGKSNATKDGYAGCYLIRCSTTFAPQCFQTGHYQPHEKLLADSPGAIKRGYYVRVHGFMANNNNAQKPGLFVNHDVIELCGLGPEISSGPDVGAIFGAAGAAPLPQGAQALPMYAAQPGAVPNMMAANPAAGAAPLPVGFAQPAAPMALPGMPAMPAQTPQMPVMPNHAALAGPGVGLAQGTPGMAPPLMPPPPVAAPVAPAYQMTPKAMGNTREALIAQGWNDDTLRANGLMV